MRKTVDRERRWRPARALSVTGALGLVVASVSIAQPASAAVPTFPDNVVVFPDRDFVSVEGYERYAGKLAIVEVTRGGTVVGSATAVVSGTDVAFEVNHPGGACWGAGTNLKVTPDIKPGDEVSVRFPDGTRESTMTSSAMVTSKAVQDGTTITVRGTYDPAEVNTAFMEQRIINPDLVPIIGRRDVRALPGAIVPSEKGGYSSGLTIGGGNFTATYEFDSLEAANLVAAAGGERAMNWQVEDADANRQGLTIAEFGEAGGPGMGGCPAGPGGVEAPSGSAVVNRSADGLSADVSWGQVTAQPGAAAVTGYQVEAVEQAASGPAAIIGKRLGTGASSTTLSGLQAGTNYTFEVRTMTGTEPKLSAPFSLADTLPGPGDVTPPTLSLSPAPQAGNLVQTDKVTVNSNGQVFFTQSPIGSPVVPVVSGDLPSDDAVLVTGPIAITSPVHLSFLALDDAGNTNVVEGDYTPAPAPAAPQPPTGLTGTTPTATSVALSWSSNDPTVSSYQVSVSAIAPTPAVTQPASVTAPRQTITGLVAGGKYTFTVTATNPTGTSDASQAFNVTMPVATDAITITTAQWKSGDFRVTGTGSVLNNTVRIYRVNADGTRGAQITGAQGAVVAAAPPAVGDWSIRLRNGAAPATNPGRVIAVSSGGGTAGPVTVANR